MKVIYDPEVDILSDAPVADKIGVILDYDCNGNMVSFEILDASTRIGNPMSLGV